GTKSAFADSRLSPRRRTSRLSCRGFNRRTCSATMLRARLAHDEVRHAAEIRVEAGIEPRSRLRVAQLEVVLQRIGRAGVVARDNSPVPIALRRHPGDAIGL